MLLNDKNIILAIKYISIFSLIMYIMQGTLYPASSFIGKCFLATYIGIGILCFTHLLLNPTRQIIIYTATAFFIANIAYYGFSDTSIISSFYDIDINSPMKNTSFVFFTLFISYFLTQKDALDKKTLLIVYALLFFNGIINFFYLSPFSIACADPINNSGYIFANLLPFLFLIKRKYVSLGILAISMSLVIISLKRGAILIAVAFTIYYIYILFKESKLSAIQKTTILTMLVLIVAVGALFLYSGNAMIQQRIDQTLRGYSSGRDILYQQLWNNWKDTDSIVNVFFGYGMSNTIIITEGSYAHNDWLELLTNMGLLGVGLYFLFFISMTKNVSELECVTNKKILISIIIIILTKSLFSMGYADQGSVPLMIMLGYAIGNNNKQIAETNS